MTHAFVDIFISRYLYLFIDWFLKYRYLFWNADISIVYVRLDFCPLNAGSCIWNTDICINTDIYLFKVK